MPSNPDSPALASTIALRSANSLLAETPGWLSNTCTTPPLVTTNQRESSPGACSKPSGAAKASDPKTGSSARSPPDGGGMPGGGLVMLPLPLPPHPGSASAAHRTRLPTVVPLAPVMIMSSRFRVIQRMPRRAACHDVATGRRAEDRAWYSVGPSPDPWSFRMRRSLALLAIAVLATPALAQDAKQDLTRAFEAVEPRVIAWRRDFHEHPELSNREFRTARIVTEHLRSLGLDAVETGIAHTGVVGTLVGGKPGPVIALRADMDALPVREQTGLPFASTATGEYNGREVPVMHACGHDTHVAMLMGAAEVLAAHRDQLAGTVKFFFQPAEEGAPAGERGGAALMIDEGVLEGPDAPEAIFALHAWPGETGSLNYRSGGFMAAADNLQIAIRGQQTHGSAPWAGVDPIHVAAQVMTALQAIPSRHLDITRGPAVITIGSISGGVRGNIIPDDVTMAGTIRTFDVGVREELHARLRRTVHAIAEAAGATAEVTIDPYAPVTTNDPELLAEMLPTLEWAAGADKVKQHTPITGAEDFALFEEHIPGLYLMLGVDEPGVPANQAAPNHSPMFNAYEGALITGVRALVGLALDYPDRRGD
ncbi:MAG: amidohydrolase [Woeseiaceae bacterium]|nr:amidohydrolase [Woeseiaceae bacterium]